VRAAKRKAKAPTAQVQKMVAKTKKRAGKAKAGRKTVKPAARKAVRRAA
jgi:hypothetical protein